MILVKIEEKANNEIYNINKDTNRSHTYILPMLGSSRSEFHYFKQCFIGDENFPKYDNHIFLLLEKIDDEYYSHYIDTLYSSNDYLDKYDVSDDLIMLIFNVPKEYQNEYNFFKNGEYSKFKSVFKSKVLSFHSLDIHSNVAKVLYRAEDLYRKWEQRLECKIDRNQEIGSIPNFNKEIFRREMKLS